MIYLDPTNDYAFRRLFGTETQKDVLISFLNSVLELENGYLITEVTLLPVSQLPHLAGLKESILDVQCRDERGITYIVEMQLAYKTGFEKRVLYYTSKAYVQQIVSGEDYPKLGQVIIVAILGFSIFDSAHYNTFGCKTPH